MALHRMNDRIWAAGLILWLIYGLAILITFIITTFAYHDDHITIYFIISWIGVTALLAILFGLDALGKKMVRNRFEANNNDEIMLCEHCVDIMLDLQYGKMLRFPRVWFLVKALVMGQGWVGERLTQEEVRAIRAEAGAEAGSEGEVNESENGTNAVGGANEGNGEKDVQADAVRAANEGDREKDERGDVVTV